MIHNLFPIVSVTYLFLFSTAISSFAGSAEVDQELRRTNDLLRQAPIYQQQAEQSGKRSQNSLNNLRANCNQGNQSACNQYNYRIRAKERYRRYLEQKQLNFYRNRRVS
jgi:hypothetical protein